MKTLRLRLFMAVSVMMAIVSFWGCEKENDEFEPSAFDEPRNAYFNAREINRINENYDVGCEITDSIYGVTGKELLTNVYLSYPGGEIFFPGDFFTSIKIEGMDDNVCIIKVGLPLEDRIFYYYYVVRDNNNITSVIKPEGDDIYITGVKESGSRRGSKILNLEYSNTRELVGYGRYNPNLKELIVDLSGIWNESPAYKSDYGRRRS